MNLKEFAKRVAEFAASAPDGEVVVTLIFPGQEEEELEFTAEELQLEVEGVKDPDGATLFLSMTIPDDESDGDDEPSSDR